MMLSMMVSSLRELGNYIDMYLCLLVEDLRMLYSVKRHKACPICEEDTCYTQLTHGRNTFTLGIKNFSKLMSYR
ncbi:hypothetical protein CR513_55029, partial [Mucuna pruriens]